MPVYIQYLHLMTQGKMVMVLEAYINFTHSVEIMHFNDICIQCHGKVFATLLISLFLCLFVKHRGLRALNKTNIRQRSKYHPWWQELIHCTQSSLITVDFFHSAVEECCYILLCRIEICHIGGF